MGTTLPTGRCARSLMRDAIRRHIDSKVTAVLPSITAEHLASWSPEQHERHREQLEQVTEGMEDLIERLAERSREHITEVALFSRRLTIRRGPDDPVTKDLVAVLDALTAMLNAIMAQPEMLKGTDRASQLDETELERAQAASRAGNVAALCGGSSSFLLGRASFLLGRAIPSSGGS